MEQVTVDFERDRARVVFHWPPSDLFRPFSEMGMNPYHAAPFVWSLVEEEAALHHFIPVQGKGWSG